MPRKKQLDIRVRSMDADIDFCVLFNSTGKHLFDQYVDSKNSLAWLRPAKKILHEDIKRVANEPIIVRLRAKFYPEDVGEEIIQDVTLHLFFLQVKEQILSEEVYCPPETCVLLASYAVQASHGDMDPSKAALVLEKETLLLPERVTSQHNLGARQWAEKVSVWWHEHEGMAREDAMREYLKIAQDLEMYGVNYFPITNKKKTELYLGVDALGLNIYDKNDKLVPKIGFPWSEISNIAYSDKKFMIKPADRKSKKDFVFYVPRLRTNKRILALCIGNHTMYMERRRPESIEVQQMKAQARDERETRKQERDRVLREMELREQAERERNEMFERVKAMEEEASAAKRLQQELEARKNEAEETARLVENERRESERLQRQLIDQVKMEQAEKDKITREIARLQRLIEQREMAVVSHSPINGGITPAAETTTTTTTHNVSYSSRSKITTILAPTSANFRPPKNGVHFHHRDEEDDEDELTDREPVAHALEVNLLAARPEESRKTTMDGAAVRVHEQLESLKRELRGARDPAKLTLADVVYEENIVAKGVDKYKTLKKIREGTVKRRIDEFEAM